MSMSNEQLTFVEDETDPESVLEIWRLEARKNYVADLIRTHDFIKLIIVHLPSMLKEILT